MAHVTRPFAQFEAGTFKVSRPQSPQDVIHLIRENGVQIVDLKFTDLPGLWQHFSIGLPEGERGVVRGRYRLRRLVHPRLSANS
jgi:hypothetical protein